MGYPHYDLVQRSHSELVAEGKIKRRTDQEQVEQDKGLLTRRAAYYSNVERDANLGLLTKTTGNNSMGYSVDLILHRDGTFWDIATDSNGMAMPSNGGPAGPDPDLASRWAPPTAELAQIDSQPGPGPQPPASGTDYTAKLDEIIAMLNRGQEVQARDTASIIARDDVNTQHIMDELHRIVENFEASARKFLVIYLAKQGAGGEPPPEGELPPPSGDGDSGLMLLLLKALSEGWRPPAKAA